MCFPSSQDVATTERVLRLLDLGLKSTHLPTKVSALYGAMYLLEAGSPDVIVQVVPMLTESLAKTLGSITQLQFVSLFLCCLSGSVFRVLAECSCDSSLRNVVFALP